MTDEPQRHQAIAIVTGGASGIGSAIVQRFAEQGFTVVIIDKASPAAEFDRTKGAVFWSVDLSDVRSIRSLPLEQFAAEVKAESITVINNVGVRGTTNFLEETEDGWAEAINTSLSASVFLTQLAIDVAHKMSLGIKICNISSVLSTLVGPQSASYGVVKAGLEYLTKYYTGLGKDLGFSIKSVAIAPGMIVQDRHAERYFSPENDSYRGLVELAHPQDSHATDKDLAHFVYWLTEKSPKFLNGQTIVFDGGLTLQEPLSLARRIHDYRETSEN